MLTVKYKHRNANNIPTVKKKEEKKTRIITDNLSFTKFPSIYDQRRIITQIIMYRKIKIQFRSK